MSNSALTIFPSIIHGEFIQFKITLLTILVLEFSLLYVYQTQLFLSKKEFNSPLYKSDVRSF